ncbi:MAG: Gfo/Idh/MocA family oxidoreductase [Candidatus Sumerlaeaceae bacterium]|nr:Gfo/Idh/MocA family oxidoreductase [Candidatus Sumerlaeaceae bacterium]
MKSIRFAVVGCGLMGQRHADIICATPECELTAVFDVDASRAKKCAGDARVAESFEQILADDSVEGVVLAVPSYRHVEMGIEVAKAGKHVIIEKPISIDVASGEKLISTCKKHGVVCAVISQNRFADGNAALKSALDSGLLGKPVLARGSVKWFRHDEYYTMSDWRGRREGEGGGVLMNQATHTLDLMLWFFGYPEVISGMISTTRPVLETEDVAVAMFRFPHQILATFEATTSAFPGFDERVEVHGPVASCIVEKGKLTFWKHVKDVPEPAPPAFDRPTEGLDPKFVLFQRQYRNIVRAMRGEEPLVVTPEQALDVVRATQEIYQNTLP